MPALNEANVRHLLRRTEIVDRPRRVAELLAQPSFAAAVDDVMDVASNPPSGSLEGLGGDEEWRRGMRMSDHWLGQMASAPRPFGERMALFWHGHITSSIDKVGSAAAMQVQIDLFRRRGLGPVDDSGNVGELVLEASVHPAMLRYLDNDRNFKDSPNQNFARELMELFLLGVGNYTEEDVEAATAAWTGHGRPPGPVTTYRFDPDLHDPAPQQFLGKTVNSTRPAIEAGFETIEVILGTGPLGVGTVPIGPAEGTPSSQVAAEFLTFKLWQEFGEGASGDVPAGVQAAMVEALLESGFDIRPWVQAMLLHDDFYTDAARAGLVRQPIEHMVALLVATGLDVTFENIPNWLLANAGQQPLYPPNVSGWRPNGYWVNSSAMGVRKEIVDHVVFKLLAPTWFGADGYVEFGPTPATRITRAEVEGRSGGDGADVAPISNGELVDRLIAATGLSPRPSTRQRIVEHLDRDGVEDAMRLDALILLLAAPEMHAA